MWALERATTARTSPSRNGDGIPDQVRARLREALADEAAASRELTGMALEEWSV
jgi:hypothetical protein